MTLRIKMTWKYVLIASLSGEEVQKGRIIQTITQESLAGINYWSWAFSGDFTMLFGPFNLRPIFSPCFQEVTAQKVRIPFFDNLDKKKKKERKRRKRRSTQRNLYTSFVGAGFTAWLGWLQHMFAPCCCGLTEFQTVSLLLHCVTKLRVLYGLRRVSFELVPFVGCSAWHVIRVEESRTGRSFVIGLYSFFFLRWKVNKFSMGKIGAAGWPSGHVNLGPFF